MSAGPIAQARADLAAALGPLTPLPVVSNVPERLAPPCVVITEAAPLLAADDTTVGAVEVRLALTVVVAPTTNALAVARLDEAVDAIVVGLVRDWGPVFVDAYTSVTSADSQAYLAAQITTHATYTIEKD
jgi:hypothetical protein